MNGMTSARFERIEHTVEFAMMHGGWIFKGTDGSVEWFDAGYWSPSKIFDATKVPGSIGMWTAF